MDGQTKATMGDSGVNTLDPFLYTYWFLKSPKWLLKSLLKFVTWDTKLMDFICHPASKYQIICLSLNFV